MSSSSVDFAVGKPPKAGKTSAVGAALDAVSAAVTGQPMNGTVNGKRGFQPGNKYGANRHQGVAAASKAHTAAKNAALKALRVHGRQRTTASYKAARQATRTAAAAHRELEAARQSRDAEKAAKKAAARTNPTPSDAPAATIASRMARTARSNGDDGAARAHAGIDNLKAAAAAGTHDGDATLAGVDRLARNATKAELFDAAQRAGIAHAATTKKALVDHLKGHVFDHGQAAKATREAASATAKPAESKVEPVAKAAGAIPAPKASPSPPAASASSPAGGLPEGRAGDRKILAAIQAVIRDPAKFGARHHARAGGDTKLVHSAHVREAVDKLVGPVDAERFNRIALDARAEGKFGLLETGDSRDYSKREIAGTIPGLNNEFHWFTRPVRRTKS